MNTFSKNNNEDNTYIKKNMPSMIKKNQFKKNSTHNIASKKNINAATKDETIKVSMPDKLVNPQKHPTEKTSKRHPIITVTGHIDHGKTTFLNYIRKIENPKLEHGGITQYIKAYKIDTKYGFMTFLDTPGHFAFNSIRKKSIKYTDIVVLIIAIEDGIKPQTIESIETAKKFNIPIIIAINKIDKADKIDEKTDKIITDLSKYDLMPEKWGGDTLMTFMSAKTGEGINDLIDLINLQAEILDLKASKNDITDGIILDNKLDVGKGSITTLIVLNGLLKKGDIIQIKDRCGKVKTISDSNYENIDEASPSHPVYITGLPGSISIGEKFNVIKNEKEVKKLQLQKNKPEQKLHKVYNLNDLIKEMKKSEQEKINIIIKADVQGTINVLKDSIEKLSTDKIKINIIKIDMGNINTSDVNLAINTASIIMGFNIKCDTKTKKLAQNNSTTIKIFNVIYDLTNYLENIIEEKSSIQKKENIIGIADVKKIFKQDNSNTIAGCVVTTGKIKHNSTIKIFRKNVMIHEGTIDSLKVFKTNTHEVKVGNECGISIKDYDNIQMNDKIKAYL